MPCKAPSPTMLFYILAGTLLIYNKEGGYGTVDNELSQTDTHGADVPTTCRPNGVVLYRREADVILFATIAVCGTLRLGIR